MILLNWAASLPIYIAGEYNGGVLYESAKNNQRTGNP